MKPYTVMITALYIGCLILAVDSHAHIREEEVPPEIFTFNGHTNILVTANASASQAAVLDYNYNISALFNGLTGTAFAFNYERQEAIYIPGGILPNTWYNSQKTFNQFFGNIPTQRILWHLGEKYGTKFDALSITEHQSKELIKILAPLTPDFADPCEVYANFLHVSKITSDAMKSPLRGFTSVMGNVNSQIRGDFRWIIGVFQGSGALFGSINGGLEFLRKKGVTLDFGKMITSASSFDTLIYVLTELKPRVDIGHALGHVLNSPEPFFVLAKKLGGEVEYGKDGFNYVILEILTYINGETSRQNLEIALNKFFQSPKTDISVISEEWPAAVRNLLETIENLELIGELPGLTKLLNEILTNTWYEKCVNMSKILNKLCEESYTLRNPVPIILKCIDEEIRSAKQNE